MIEPAPRVLVASKLRETFATSEREPANAAHIACYAIAMRWGVHPVLEAALSHLDETAVPEEIERSLPPRGTLSTRALVEIAALSIAHARPRASRAQRAEFERLAALVDRWLSEARSGDQPWHRDLHAARRDFEHGRGALKVAARAAEIAAADLLRSAPGVGPEAVALTSDAVDRTARLLANDEAALHAFVLALCARVGALQAPSRR